MKPPLRLSLIAVGLGAAAAAFFAACSNAALPPQYDRWSEFAAIISDNSIPAKLGVYSPAERIERIGEASYRVYGGKCFVAVALSRTNPTGPQGQPLLGGVVVTVASVGEPTCQ